MTDDITHYDAVEAYCDQLSYLPGDSVGVHVSCQTDSYDITIERWGADRQTVWTSTLPGHRQSTPADADANGCNWERSVAVEIGDDWRSGFYLITLRAHGAPPDRATGFAGFVVRAPIGRRGRRLLVLATNTYHAYNTWGGKSLYSGATRVSFRRPFGRGLLWRAAEERDDRKSRPTRWNEEPDVDGYFYQAWRHANGYAGFAGSTGWYTYERRFVEWAEHNDLELDFATSRDLAVDPAACEGYELVLSVGHDEYWSAAQRSAIERHIGAGGNFATFSGNTCFWQVRPDDDANGYTCFKYRAHLDDPVVGTPDEASMTGMWADPLVGQPEAAFLGAGSAWGLYARFGHATARGSGAFTVYRDDHWLFDGTELLYGDLLGARNGVVGYETVGCRITFDDDQLPIPARGDHTPDDMTIVAFTPSSNLAVGTYPKSTAAPGDQGDLDFIAERIHGDRFGETARRRARIGNAVIAVSRPFGRDGGEVVTIGSTDWVFGLADDRAVATVTENVLTRLAPASPLG